MKCTSPVDKIAQNEASGLIENRGNEEDAELSRYQVRLLKSIHIILSEVMWKGKKRIFHFVIKDNDRSVKMADAPHELQSHVGFKWKRKAYLYVWTCVRCKENLTKFGINQYKKANRAYHGPDHSKIIPRCSERDNFNKDLTSLKVMIGEMVGRDSSLNQRGVTGSISQLERAAARNRLQRSRHLEKEAKRGCTRPNKQKRNFSTNSIKIAAPHSPTLVNAWDYLRFIKWFSILVIVTFPYSFNHVRSFDPVCYCSKLLILLSLQSS